MGAAHGRLGTLSSSQERNGAGTVHGPKSDALGRRKALVLRSFKHMHAAPSDMNSKTQIIITSGDHKEESNQRPIKRT